MVARDSKTHKARKVNPLIIESEAEKELFECGQGSSPLLLLFTSLLSLVISRSSFLFNDTNSFTFETS